MNDNQRRAAIKKFVNEWRERGSEKSDAQSFWIAFLRDVLDVSQPEQIVHFEKPVVVDSHMCFIDAWIPETRALIEQKSRGIDLDKPERQSDGKFLTPFEQAKRYAANLPYSEIPRWIVVCNFDEIRIYDLKQLPSLSALFDEEHTYSLEPQVIAVNRLEFEYARLNFLVDRNDENVYPEVKVSKTAVRIIGRLYSAFLSSYGEMNSARRDALNKLCVRIVFCFYAEDSGLFPNISFRDYINQADDKRRALLELFRVLDIPDDAPEREQFSAELQKFPCIDGGLFGEEIDIPLITKKILHYLTDKNFSWREIDPPIFGAMFEQTLNIDIIRPGGMHYTSTDIIHKVLDPLFMDALYDEFRKICRMQKDNRREKLEKFQRKIAALKFFDPACGSGNFLTETYISLRRLENGIFRAVLAVDKTAPCEIEVSIDQFFGIELNDYAAAVAQTAMWISENQMLRESNEILHDDQSSLPLQSSARIVCGNALELDWKEIAPNVDYVIGNPPFSGARLMSPDKKAELLRVFDGWNNAGNLDYVCCWFKRAADFMIGTKIRAAFVATNSICQGESVSNLWSKLFEIVHIDFAHRTFRWTQENESEKKERESKSLPAPKESAAVYCVVVGFSVARNSRKKLIFEGKQQIVAQNINGYLLNAPNFFVESRSKPLCDVPKMGIGNQPIDGGNYLFTAEEMDEFLQREPRAKKYFRPWYGAEEFLKGRPRYCLWLGGSPRREIMSLPRVAVRVEAVRQYRRTSKAPSTRKLADTPTHFNQENMPTEKFIVVPEVSSERRRYVPIGFMTPDVLCSNLLKLIPNADMYHFGVLTSSVHMAWIRVVCGRLEMRYRYSSTIVYNNFPWCTPTTDQRTAIERSAQAILDARAQFPDRSLASLYDETEMPDVLRAAHAQNDRAVMEAYNFDASLSESELVSRLMQMYRELITAERSPEPDRR